MSSISRENATLLFEQLSPKKGMIPHRWDCPSVTHLLENYGNYLANLKRENWVNVFYTAAVFDKSATRKDTPLYQEIFPIDIDDVNPEHLQKSDEYSAVVCQHLNINTVNFSFIFTGNGFHILIHTPAFDPTEFYQTKKVGCKAFATHLTAALQSAGLSGHVDTAVYEPKRLLRLPGARNVKDKKGVKEAKLLWIAEKPLERTVETLLPIAASEPKAPKRVYPKIDVDSVLQDCLFLQQCKDNAASLDEPSWHKMIGITAHVDPSGLLSHEFSREYPGYDFHETQRKHDLALTKAGPRTCESIDADVCKECKWFGKISSPVQIKQNLFVSTSEQGFFFSDEKGNLRPDLKGICTHFHEVFHCKVQKSGQIYVYNGKYYRPMPDIELNQWLLSKFTPNDIVKENTLKECRIRIKATYYVDESWFTESCRKKVNFQNGYLDLVDQSFHPHSPDVGFRGIVEYDYDANATTHVWDEFCHAVFSGCQQTKRLVEEFLGYALSGDPYIHHKALVLDGEGSNGKSTLIKLIRELFGPENYSNLNLNQIKFPNSVVRGCGKLINLSEETPEKALSNSYEFKNITDGGVVTGMRKYQDEFDFTWTAKLVFATNKTLLTNDTTHALYRRLIIIPMHVKFSDSGDGMKEDKTILRKLLLERSGIVNQCLRSYASMKDSFTNPPRVIEALEEYKSNVDTVLNFINEHLEISPMQSDLMLSFDAMGTPAKDIYRAYQQYCSDTGVPGSEQLRQVHFFNEMKKTVRDLKARRFRAGYSENKAVKYYGIKVLFRH